jgi:hypothetical protein
MFRQPSATLAKVANVSPDRLTTPQAFQGTRIMSTSYINSRLVAVHQFADQRRML